MMAAFAGLPATEDVDICPDECPACGRDLRAEGYPPGHQTDEGNVCTFAWNTR